MELNKSGDTRIQKKALSIPEPRVMMCREREERDKLDQCRLRFFNYFSLLTVWDRLLHDVGEGLVLCQ